MKKFIEKGYKKGAIILLAIALFGSSVFLPKQASAATNSSSLSVNAKSAILVDAKTGKILFEKNADQALPPASMTKLMTEYLVLKALDKGQFKLSSHVPVDSKVQSLSRDPNFSGFSMNTVYPYTVDDMLKALLIPSSNAAAVAFANLISGNEANFVTLMNKTAQSLGMTETHYVNASGLDNKDIYADLGSSAIAQGGQNGVDKTSARDLSILAYHLLNDFSPSLFSTVVKISSTARTTIQVDKNTKQTITNTNWMLPGFSQFGQNMQKYEYQGVDGFKTGYTNLAGYCFTGTAVQGSRRLITVVMGATDAKGNLLTTPGPNGQNEGARFLVTQQLLDYGFQQTGNTTITNAGYIFKNQKTLPVTKGKQNSVPIAVKQSLSLPLVKGDKKNYKLVLHLDKSKLDANGALKAPVKKGEKVGYATVENTGSDQYGYIIGTAPKLDVVTTASVDKASWISLLFRSIGHFFGGLFHHSKK